MHIKRTLANLLLKKRSKRHFSRDLKSSAKAISALDKNLQRHVSSVDILYSLKIPAI